LNNGTCDEDIQNTIPMEKIQQKQQKRCVECYGTKIYTRKLRKIYFREQFSYMEVKCKQTLKKTVE
jgi:hypothetical protein